jgi:predicted Zn finger-like uncharacterized protein
MQANCPECSYRIVIDDSRVPDRPFSVKCPKCQKVARFPGKGQAAAPAEPPPPQPKPTPPPMAPPPAEAPPAPSQAAWSGASSPDELRVQMMAQLRREMGGGEGHPAGRRALVALADRPAAGAITLTLTRQGYAVESVDDLDEAGRLLEQGVFSLVVTARVGAAPGKPETLYQRINRLSPEGRRRLFLILVGDEFQTGEGTQAFTCLADLVVHADDAAKADGVLVNTLAERERIYKVFLDARARFEASSA